MQCAPAFDYARSSHTTTIINDDSIPDGPPQKKALFESDALSLDLRYVTESSSSEGVQAPEVTLELLDLSAKGHKGLAVQSLLELTEGQCVTFILRIPPAEVATHGGKNENKVELAKQSTTVETVKSTNNHKRRAFDDPFLTTELVSSLLHVSYITFISSFFLSQFLYRLRFVIGMNGSVNRHTPGLGKRLSYAVRWR